MRNDRGGSLSSSKGKKKSNSEKPRPPRRGLGVDQLERILHGNMASPCITYPGYFNHEDMRVQNACSSFSYSSTSLASYGFLPSKMMGHCEYYQSTIIYADSLPTTTTSWNTRNGILDGQYFAQPNKTRQLLNLIDSKPTKIKQRSNSVEPSSRNSESGDARELDLELRLSL
ncbi:Elongation factor Ts isoform 1 [Hibiscus syriacus]|uniref:Elongation factor Ts isoform 1 n=1 Tax=Hibiscus syriacus TaxID=106335 RepID=A0A6A2ZKB4_HIBSY|nr:Elongation factor Ts isoform 1 [Hibiscus syriacus]